MTKLTAPFLRPALCGAMMALAIPALAPPARAATDDAAAPHHHRMHGKHGMMRHGDSADDAATDKLNDESLQKARATTMPPAPAPTTTDTTTAPGTGATMPTPTPASGNMGTSTPGNAPPSAGPATQ